MWPLRSLRSLAAACVVVLDPKAEHEQVVSTIGALGGILDVMLELMQLADVEDAAECGGIDLERGAVRGMRAFRRGSCAGTCVVVFGGCLVDGWWVSVCNRYKLSAASSGASSTIGTTSTCQGSRCGMWRAERA